MKIASVADVKAKFSAYLKASEQGPNVETMLLSVTVWEDEWGCPNLTGAVKSKVGLNNMC